MYLVGAQGQQSWHNLYDASGSLSSGNATLLLPQQLSRTFLYIQNLGTHNMAIDFGGARATATLTSNAVSSISVTNVGFGYTLPPLVEFYGGGNPTNSAFLGIGLPGYQSPQKVASAHATLGTGGTAGQVASITVDNPGAGYQVAPFVFLRNNPNDPSGAAAPTVAGSIILYPSSTTPNSASIFELNGTFCTTDAISIIGTSGDKFICKWAP